MTSWRRVFGEKFRKFFLGSVVLIGMAGVLILSPGVFAAYSASPRQTGALVLDELLTGSIKFIIRVGSNGYTDKSSFKVEIQKNG